jgi:hypothetical protein
MTAAAKEFGRRDRALITALGLVQLPRRAGRAGAFLRQHTAGHESPRGQSRGAAALPLRPHSPCWQSQVAPPPATCDLSGRLSGGGA